MGYSDSRDEDNSEGEDVNNAIKRGDCKHRALAPNNVDSRKIRIWLKIWEIDIRVGRKLLRN